MPSPPPILPRTYVLGGGAACCAPACQRVSRATYTRRRSFPPLNRLVTCGMLRPEFTLLLHRSVRQFRQSQHGPCSECHRATSPIAGPPPHAVRTDVRRLLHDLRRPVRTGAAARRRRARLGGHLDTHRAVSLEPADGADGGRAFHADA